MSDYERGTLTLSNGDHLSYIKQGSGPVVVLLPGWSQSAAQWKHQIDDLAQDHTIYAVDLRGHGDSSNASGGYRIARLAADLHEALELADLDDVTLMGHSMGCSVMWAYLEHYGTDRISRLVIADQAPMVTGKPWLTDEEKVTYGCLFPDAASLEGFVSAVNATDTVEGHKEIIRGMFTADIDEDTLAWIAEENLKLPRGYAADLLWDHCLQDWRDVITETRLPTLVIGAEKSIFSAESQRWIAAQNPNASVVIFEESDGGSHFMFFENPDRFNRHVREFLSA